MDGTVQIEDDTWTVAGRTFHSRLIVGTGKYKDYATNAAAAEAAGAEIVTVALRRVNLSDPRQPMLVDYVKPSRFTFLPNTAGCFTGEDAVRTLRLAREAGGWDLVKLEVLSDTRTLFPDMEETLRALKMLVAEEFKVMVYCSDDPVYARKLEDAGAVAIMPLGALIGSGLGIQNKLNIHLIVDQAKVPVLWERKGLYSVRLAAWHYWIATLGIVFYISSMWVAGIEEGLMWRAYDSNGFLQYSFIESVMAVHPFYIIRMLGGVMFLLGALLMAYNLFMTVQSASTAQDRAGGFAPGAMPAAAE